MHLLDAAWMVQASPDDIRVVLHGGADPAERGPDGETALHYAVEHPNVEILETLLEYGADPIVANFAGQTALNLAAGRADRREHALALVRFGANYDGLDSSVRSLLGLPSTSEALGEIRLERLLQSDWAGSVSIDRLRRSPAFGPDPDASVRLHGADLQALFRRVLAGNRDPEVTSFLIERGAELVFADGVHALHVAARNANPDVVKSLLDRGEPDVSIAQEDASQRVALHYAAANENPAVAAILLEAGAEVDSEDESGLRALHVAALNPNPAVANLLLDAGATLDVQDEYGRTALHVAAENVNPAVAQSLLGAGADADVEDKAGRTPLQRAIDQGNSRVLGILRAGDDLSEAELIIAIGEESRRVVADLVDDLQQPLLNFYLRIALLNPDAGVAQLLLEKGAEVGAARLAAINPNPAVMALLLERGADPNAADVRGLRPLHVAALNPNPAVVALLLENGAEANAVHVDGRTVLHFAAGNANPAVAQNLLKAGADPNTEDRSGQRALHVAALNVNPAVAELLLDEGAELTSADEDGRTALHLAADNPNPAVVALLLKGGADVNARDTGQASPLTLAWRNPRSAVPAALLSASATRTALEDRLLDIDWLNTATATDLVAQIANAFPSAFRRRDEECGRTPVHLIAHFAARNNLDERLVDLDSRLTADKLWRIDHRNNGFLAMLERGVSLEEMDNNGNSVLHYAVSGAGKVGLAVASQTFPSAGLDVVRDLQALGADGQATGAAGLLPIHYAQPGRAFTDDGNTALAKVLADVFAEPGTESSREQFLPETDPCVVLGMSAEPTTPADLTAH